MGKTCVSKTLYCRGNSFECNSLNYKKHTYTNPRPGQYLMHVHAYSHIMQAVVAIDSCSTIGSKNRENPCLLLRWVCSAKHSYKHQLHTTGPRHGSFPTTRREVGSWVGVCVPLALSLSYENGELKRSTE